MVHICFDKSIVHLLEASTDFIMKRQVTALDALGLFLEYAQPDDLVKNLKKIMHYLMIVYSHHQEEEEVKEKVFCIIQLLAHQLPSSDIYLDVSLAKLNHNDLMTEKNGLDANQTVLTVMVFLYQFLLIKPDGTSERVLKAIERPGLKQFLGQESIHYMKEIRLLIK